ncbi:SERF family protein, 4F5S-like protein, implicated in mRNA splicing [Schizosaccharomyces osmophilus]|uniref:SERF family protein, 4F5S-like protein, implicated in mRNA splicing n=1 Tax=Schizosaccharomyces osmophilus TaxID=2545709 RepID=A0AAF0AWA6_9SCHI|nr:SERF family protein, 4F5S-like protein, implicated in mRNA splicing [Schizosaccharomyces osmophilus]WBW72860.1 SERF family protein, 4F5S-like protein, implicated in mRNA splicing [Schizosaccharomyces osmophilus]
MSRGNQRETDRVRNAKKQQAGKKKQDGNPAKRLEAQAEIMRAKQRAADEKKGATGSQK